MKKLLCFIIPLIFIIFAVAGYLIFKQVQKKDTSETSDSQDQEEQSDDNLTINDQTMKIQSPAFADNTQIPQKYTCDGEGINPSLTFSDAPAKARSLVLIVDDPDAPGGTWTHWIMWNIDPAMEKIPENFKGDSIIQGINSWGRNDYGAPCPPSGTHRYVFKLFALDKKIDLAPATKVQALEQEMEGHVLESAELIGLYSKK